MKEQQVWIVILFGLTVLSASVSHAHKNHHHGQTQMAQESPIDSGTEKAIADIAGHYADQIKPIFQNKCLNCHGGQTVYPWYYKIPVAKQLIDSDVKEASEHIDMSRGFPFGGHGNPKDDLEAVRDAVNENSMPPFRYWILHFNLRLTQEEKDKVV